jgi:hypothetical protein
MDRGIAKSNAAGRTCNVKQPRGRVLAPGAALLGDEAALYAHLTAAG